jgi:hypothetical protein
MNCDVCNATISNLDRKIPAEKFSLLLDRGFGINETNIEMLTDAGVARSEAIAMLSEQYRALQSDWILCTTCFVKAESNLTS